MLGVVCSGEMEATGCGTSMMRGLDVKDNVIRRILDILQMRAPQADRTRASLRIASRSISRDIIYLVDTPVVMRLP
jgi:hypothetical protein